MMNRLNPFRLLNSIWFGLLLTIAVVGYVALGWWGVVPVQHPWATWLDRTSVTYLRAWPLKALTILLAMTVIVTTWRRIPLVAARYGRWCISCGLLLVLGGINLHESMKMDGRARIYTESGTGPNAIDQCYDAEQRSLYVRVGQEQPAEIPLPTLPVLGTYDDQHANAGVLNRAGLAGIQPSLEITDSKTGLKRAENLAELIGLHGQILKLDVVGFYPRAIIKTDFHEEAGSVVSGVEWTGVAPTSAPVESANKTFHGWLVGSDPRFKTAEVDDAVELQHFDADNAMAAELMAASTKLFHLEVTLADQPAIPLDVAIGQTYQLAKIGYTFSVEDFNPRFGLSGTGEKVAVLTLLINKPAGATPAETFRRMIIEGKPTQTDFRISDDSPSPMGVRQKTPIDSALKIDFQVHDPFHLLPKTRAVKHTFLTPSASAELIDITAGSGASAVQIARLANGSERLSLPSANGKLTQIQVQRRDHIRAVDQIVSSDTAHIKDQDDSGPNQIVAVRASLQASASGSSTGNWSTLVYAPFAAAAADHVSGSADGWHGGYLSPPGAIAPLQIQLGNSIHLLPARISLESVKPDLGQSMTSAEKGDPAGQITTVEISNFQTGEAQRKVLQGTETIAMGGGWQLSQRQVDPSRSPCAWVELNIASHPALG